ncbi:acyl-CoA synthetase [Pseudomonas sp. Z3-6]
MIRHFQDIRSIESAPLPNSSVASTYALFERSANQYANTTALSFFLRVEDHAQPVRWSYSELLADITRAANLFHRLGVQREDVVALVMPSLPETHIATWGAQTAGIAFAVNNQLEGVQMAELLRAAKARWLVTVSADSDADIWARVQAAIAELPDLLGVLVVDVRRYLPQPPDTQLKGRLGRLPVYDFNRDLLNESGKQLNFAPPKLDDMAAYFCTGGTTGVPKIARHSQRNEVLFCGQLEATVGGSVLGEGLTVLTALPLFHVNGLILTGLAVFAAGGHVLLATPAGYRTPQLIPRFWEIVATHKVSSYSGVPTIFSALMQVPVGEWDTSSLTVAICGAAPMPAEIIRRFERHTGQRILEGYGLTEGTCASSVNPDSGESRAGSVGMRIPWQNMRAMLLDEQGRWLRDSEVDEVGIICISGPNVFAGYLDETHNKGAWFDSPDGRRWFNTGDLGRCDGEGYFWLTGRKKELIIRGGHNIDPRSIEDVLAAHPAVAMCAAVARPDSYAGELPVAYVQLRTGVKVRVDELQEYASLHIAERAAVPKEVILIDAFPLTAIGKIFKPALLLREVQQLVYREAAALGMELQYVRVEQDATRGIVAQYRGIGDVTALAEALAGYAFSSEAV